MVGLHLKKRRRRNRTGRGKRRTKQKKEDLAGGTPEENARLTEEILQGEQPQKRTAVLLNAGAALYLAQKADTLEEGVRLAAELIDSKKALQVLRQLQKLSAEREQA